MVRGGAVWVDRVGRVLPTPTYVGGKIGLFDEPYDLDYLSFIEIEIKVKKFGY